MLLGRFSLEDEMTVRKWVLGSLAMSFDVQHGGAGAVGGSSSARSPDAYNSTSNKSSSGAGYDVATVRVDGDADKVYQTALTMLKTNHPEDHDHQQRCQKARDQVCERRAGGEHASDVARRQNLTQLVCCVEPDPGYKHVDTTCRRRCDESGVYSNECGGATLNEHG